MKRLMPMCATGTALVVICVVIVGAFLGSVVVWGVGCGSKMTVLRPVRHPENIPVCNIRINDEEYVAFLEIAELLRRDGVIDGAEHCMRIVGKHDASSESPALGYTECGFRPVSYRLYEGSGINPLGRSFPDISQGNFGYQFWFRVVNVVTGVDSQFNPRSLIFPVNTQLTSVNTRLRYPDSNECGSQNSHDGPVIAIGQFNKSLDMRGVLLFVGGLFLAIGFFCLVYVSTFFFYEFDNPFRGILCMVSSLLLSSLALFLIQEGLK